MKRAIILFISSISISFASPAVMGGFTFKFGSNSADLSNAGATIKVLSTKEEKKPVVGAGVSYYPWAKDSKKFGVDVSAGYNFKNASIMGGWDFLQKQPSFSLGYSKEISSDDETQFSDGIQDARCTANKEKEEESK